MSLQLTPGDQVRAQLQRVLESKPFKASAVHRELLAYLAEKSLADEAENLKEYAVGVDCLGKPVDYDPRQDSSVRMHVARLRQKLDEYYRNDGKDDGIVIDLPKGAFRLVFAPRAVEPVAEPAPPPPAAPRRRRPPVAELVAGALAVALVVSLARSRGPSTPPLTPQLQQIWAPLLESERRLAVCLAVPVFGAVPEFEGVVGPLPGDWEAASKSSALAAAKEAFRSKSASPSYDYTDVATATGAFRLGQFLAGRSKDVLLTRGDLVTLPELDMDNLVYVGSPQGNPQLQAILANRQFSVDNRGVRDLHPPAGKSEYVSESRTADADGMPRMHALITRAPTPGGNGYLFYLTGSSESGILAAVQTVTDETVARRIFAKVKRADGTLPRYFQVALSVRSMEDMPIDIAYVTHRELPGPGSR